MKKIFILLFICNLFSEGYAKDLWEKYLIRMENYNPQSIDEALLLELLEKRYTGRIEENGDGKNKNIENQYENKENIEQKKERNISFLVQKALEDEEGAIRQAIVIYIVNNKLRQYARQIVEKIEKTEDVTEKKLLIWALGEIGNEKDILAMVEYLRNEKNPYILNLLAAAISKIAQSSGSIQPLIILLENSNNLYIKATSLIGLGKIGDPRSFPIVWKMATEHPTKEIRFCAVIALSNIMKKDEKLTERLNVLWHNYHQANSNYEKLALAFTIQKLGGFNLGLYNFMVNFLKLPVFNEVAMDLLEELPYPQGRDRLEIAAMNQPNHIIKNRINELVYKLRAMR